MNKITNQTTSSSKIIFILILFSILTRMAMPPFLGHPANFSPLDAIALFCGAYFNRRITACIAIVFIAWLSDFFIDKIFMGYWTFAYQGFYWQYASYFLITLIGTLFRNKITPVPLLFASLSASMIFFIISNFGVWCSGFLYPLTMNGLVACYVAAIPFFKNTVLSDLFFSAFLFGVLMFSRKQKAILAK